ncbi:MAG: hypothetical protein OXL33_06865 [Chloroflexota bacterium]|nr:hypothetical protein [Chloroflexota bacterium]
MPEQEPVPLEQLSVSSIWNHEALDFNPWLAENIHRLGEAVGMNLEFVDQQLRLEGAGIADIVAKQAETEASVIIELQLYDSDDDHFVRLLGYAAASQSDIVIWVAGRFADRHLRVLEWLNRDDEIQYHAVVVRGWRIGETQGFSFEQLVGPHPSLAGPKTERWNWTTACAAFYRPLTQRLRGAGIQMIGRNGFRGRYRTFHTGLDDPGIAYALGLNAGHYGHSPHDRVAVRISGDSYGQYYDRLADLRAELVKCFDECEIFWPNKDIEQGYAWLGLARDPSSLESLRSDPEPTREWMFDRLVRLWNVVQPRLDELGDEFGIDRPTVFAPASE